jgi:hypothetical protein
VIVAVAAIVASVVLAGCARDPGSAPPLVTVEASSPAAPSSAPGDLTGDQITCLDAGEAILEARVPPAYDEPTPGREYLDLDARVLDAVAILDGLHAMGDLAAGIERVMTSMAETTAFGGAQSGRPWADRRDDLTAATEELLAACQAVGVPDFLNP